VSNCTKSLAVVRTVALDVCDTERQMILCAPCFSTYKSEVAVVNGLLVRGSQLEF
jgi:hypothetical protein